MAVLAALALVGLSLVVLPGGARAQDDDLRVEHRHLDPGSEETRVRVALEGVRPGDRVEDARFRITEDGEDVGDVAVVASAEAPDPPPRSVMLAMDVSDSTLGPARERSVAAAGAFASSVMAQGVDVGVVAFAVRTEVLQPPTDDLAAVEAALDGMSGGPRTRLYDAVVTAAETLAEYPGERAILVFSDGADVGSVATLETAGDAAAFVGAPVTSVALATDQFDVASLEALADRTGGRVVEVDGVEGLAAAFADVAADFQDLYVLSYATTERSGLTELSITVELGPRTATTTVRVLKPLVPAADPPEPVAVGSPGVLGDDWVGPAAVAAAGVGVALLLLALFVPVGDRQVARNLRRAMGSEVTARERREDLSPTTAALSRRAVDLVERVPKPSGYDPSVQRRIDRAGWPLRSSEFTTLRLIAALVGLGLGWSLANVVVGVGLGALGWVVPSLVLQVRVEARQRAFMDQLPDTLQLLAGSMKAGYGVLQAIDTVVKESDEPTRSEFQRVLLEARLGLPLDDSLADMADRIGTEDFRWVAVSISIQRRVGGNLAQLLETVAETLRERSATTRQVKALSAEGRLSALILVVLPLGLAGYMLLVNPAYLEPLWTTGFGQALSVGAVVLMALGVAWMRRLIQIDV